MQKLLKSPRDYLLEIIFLFKKKTYEFCDVTELQTLLSNIVYFEFWY